MEAGLDNVGVNLLEMGDGGTALEKGHESLLSLMKG